MSTHSLAAVALAAATFVSGCINTGVDESKLMVFNGAYQEDVRTLDPANAYDPVSLDVVPNIYETLYQYAYLSDTYKVVPLLAADMPKYSSDRLTVTIPIRQGIRFQDDSAFRESSGRGRELKAQDFVYALKRLALPSLQSQGWWILDGKIKGINAFHATLLSAKRGDVPKLFLMDVEGIKALDDHTLQLKLTRPYPQLPYVLAMAFTAPVPAEAITAYGDEDGNLSDHPIGTGPFVLKEWKRGHRIVLERNPNYHPEFYPSDGSMELRKKGLLADAGKPLPILDRVVMRVIKEQDPAWLAFGKGELDVLSIPRDNFERAIASDNSLVPDLAKKGVRLSIETGTTFYYVSFNMKDRLIGGNKHLRQALSSAIDRDRWLEVFAHGRGEKAPTALPPGLADRPAKPQLKYGYDTQLAKSLLKKAGYPEGKGLPTINLDMRGADSLNRQMGEFFTEQFAAVGVKVNVIYNTLPAFLQKMRQGNLQLSFGGWQLDYPDAENVFQLLYGSNKAPGPNESNFDHPEMNALYEKVAMMTSGKKRSELVRQMDAIMQEEVPWALGFYHTDYQVAQPWVLNFRGSDIITNRYKYLRVNQDVKQRYLQTQE